jgi:hypothetical protein
MNTHKIQPLEVAFMGPLSIYNSRDVKLRLEVEENDHSIVNQHFWD